MSSQRRESEHVMEEKEVISAHISVYGLLGLGLSS
jgi:hypothetical protein